MRKKESFFEFEKFRFSEKIKFRKIVMTWHQDFSSTEDFEKNVSLVPISRATNNGEDTSYDFFRK